MEESDERGRYKVVVNHEEQYSIWPEDRDNPLGWTDVGVSGPKTECLDHIEKVWTDMRPLSLRKWMEENPDDVQTTVEDVGPPHRDLVEFLASQEHEVALVIRGSDEAERLKSLLEREFVQIRFPGTDGGTELTVELDRSKSDLSALERDLADDAQITLVGSLELDYRPVECRAIIRLQTLEGTGRLMLLEST